MVRSLLLNRKYAVHPKSRHRTRFLSAGSLAPAPPRAAYYLKTMQPANIILRSLKPGIHTDPTHSCTRSAK